MRLPLVSRIGHAFAALRGRMAWPGVGGSGSVGVFHGGYGWTGTLPGTNVNVAREVGDPALNGAVSICLNWIADQFPEPEFRVVRKKRDGTDAPIPRHPLPELIAAPNPYYDGDALWAATIVSYCISGDAYWYKVKDNIGRVKELWHLPYWQIRPRWPADGSEFISYYDYYVDGKPFTIRPQDLVHFRFSINLATRRGVSRLGPVLRSVLADNEADTYAYSILKNMGIPGALICPAPGTAGMPSVAMNAEVREEVKQLWMERVSGDNRGMPIVFGDPIDVKPVGLSPEQLTLTTIRDRPEDRICAALRLPPMVVGLTSGAAHKTYCLPANARVWTLEGPKPIVAVKAGDLVWSFVDGALQPRRVTRRWKTGRKRLYELRTKNRILRATDNHPILTRVVGSKDGKNSERHASFEWRALGKLKAGDRIVQAKHLPDMEGTTLPDGREATPDMMQFLGAMVGDGSVHPPSARVQMSMPPADRCAAHYRELAEALFTKTSGREIHLYSRPRYFEFGSAAACRTLVAFGFVAKAKVKRVPGWVFGLSRPLRLAFLAGLVDSDGSIDKRGALTFGFANQALTHDVRALLVSCGIECSNVAHWMFPASVLPQQGRKLFYDHWHFTASSAVSVAEIPFSDPRYRERVDANQHRFRGGGWDSGKAGLASELGFFVIRSIRPMGVEDVYDLEVEGGHSFIADGVVVHNSNLSEAYRRAYYDCIIPMQKRMCGTLSRDLDLIKPGEIPKWDYETVECLAEDQNTKATRTGELYQKHQVIKLDEARIIIGLKALPNGKGDVFFSEKALEHATALAEVTAPNEEEGEDEEEGPAASKSTKGEK